MHLLQAFVEKESSFEGAELPAAASREGVSFNSKRFWNELGAALGMQPGDNDPFLQDMVSDSDDEGSSFFGGASEDADTSSDDDADASAGAEPPNVYRAQRAERAQNGQAFPRGAETSSTAGGMPETAAQPSLDANTLTSGSGPGKVAVEATAAAPARRAPAPSQGIKRGFLSGSAGASGRPGKAEAGPSRAAGAAAASQAASRPGASSAFVRSPAARPAEGMPLEDDQRWETLTATDSDDDEAAGDADFLTEYEERMERELGRSKVGATFERGPAGPTPAAGSAGAKGKGKAAVVEDMGDAPGFVGGQGTRARVGKVEEGEEEEELRPVDIDLNLVQNLLASYSGQQGLPGPASNLVGLLGLHLPDDEDSRGKSAFDSFMS
jgi:hypothetical protein